MPDRNLSPLPDDALGDGPRQPVRVVARLCEGRDLSPSAIVRRAQKGLRVGGQTVRLPALRTGRGWVTTVRAYEQFLLALTEAARAAVTDSDAPSERSPEMARRLEQAGLLTPPGDSAVGRRGDERAEEPS